MAHGGSREERLEMLRQHHRSTLWVPAACLILGLFLATSPAGITYRSPLHAWSDLLSGIAVMGLSALWLANARRFWAQWGVAVLGFWLLMAPLVFWAPAAAYVSNTVAGALLMAMAILVPGMPAMMLIMQAGPETPPGWSYNPSSWLQRAPIIALAVVSFFAARHLTAYQMGHTDWVWDPVFGDGTHLVLTSEVSQAWPISDAGLGAVAYMLEVLMAFMGCESRWRTMPWMVTFFGILVVPLGVVSITLVILQPVAVGEWCTLCLFTALLMLVMIPLAVDEVWAMGMFLIQARREGQPFWRTFFYGGTIEGGKAKDERKPDLLDSPRRTLPAMVWGISMAWTLVASAALGLWMVAAPAVLGSAGTAADSSMVVGALVVTWSVIVTAEVVRPARYLNVLFGLWLIASPWVVEGFTTAAAWNTGVVGLAVVLLCLPRGPIKEQYGSWQRMLQ